MVRNNYELRYQEALASFRKEKPSLKDYLFTYRSSKGWVLIKGLPVYDSVLKSYKYFTSELEEYLADELKKPNATIVEFGCGNGRNLLFLKSRYPNVNFVGVEFSRAGINLCRESAKQYGLDITFIEADITTPLDIDMRATCVVTCHALEQTPRSLTQVLQNITKVSNGRAVFFEPITELYSWISLRDITAKARAVVIDHVRNLLSTLKAEGFEIKLARRLGLGSALTETAVVIVQKAC